MSIMKAGYFFPRLSLSDPFIGAAEYCLDAVIGRPNGLINWQHRNKQNALGVSRETLGVVALERLTFFFI